MGAPDHTTLSRRGRHLDVELRQISTGKPILSITDSTGLSFVGEGEWAAAICGVKGRRGWQKLHLGVDGSGVIVSHVLTDGSADDARAGLEVIDAVSDEIQTITGDAAYDAIAVCDAGARSGAKAVVPPLRTAVVSKRGRRSSSRDRTIRRVTKLWRRRWRKESVCHRQGTVENASFRYKTILGDRFRAGSVGSQEAEALIACNVLNRMFELGRPESVAIAP